MSATCEESGRAAQNPLTTKELLRRRTAALNDGSFHKSTTQNATEAQRIQKMALSVLRGSKEMPPWLQRYIEISSPYLRKLKEWLRAAAPVVYRGTCQAAEVYHKLPKNATVTLWGLSLCFFGGRYAVTIAAIEAFQATGGSHTMVCVRDLCQQLRHVKEASDQDDSEDNDKDGVADVQQINAQELVERKALLALRVVDPEILSSAMGGIWTGYMGVLAVLKFEFAQTVAVAHSIGDYMRPMLAKVAGPVAVQVVPPEYHQWVSPGINLCAKTLATVLAWKIQRIVSTVHTGVAGGLLTTRSLLALLRDLKALQLKEEDTMIDELTGYALAGSGIYWQLFRGGAVPFFLAPFLWPLDFLEWWLKWSVTWMGKANNGIADKS